MPAREGRHTSKHDLPIRLLNLLLFSASAFAQSGNATLNGTVTDGTGALIPSAHVSVTKLATGVAKTVDTTSSGLYVVTALIPGTYKVEIKAAGFKTEAVNDVKLVIDEVARVDARLEVGVATQNLTVTGESACRAHSASSAKYGRW